MGHYQMPLCSNCGISLKMVFETTSDTYKWDRETGHYQEKDGDSNSTCSSCGADVSDLFPDGICNYQADYIGDR